MSDPDSKRKWLTTLGAVSAAVLATAALTAALTARVASGDAVPRREAIPVRSTAFAIDAHYEREQRFLGLIRATARSRVGFEIPGTIAQILVKEGDAVALGTALARLDTASLDARRQAALAALAQTAAELELARARTKRQAPLQASGAIAAQTFDDTRLTEQAIEARLDAATARLRALDVELEKSVLRAPYAARVGRRLTDRGAVTRPGTPVFTLVAAAEREAHIGIAVEQARALQTGRAYPLTWRGARVNARLRAVRPEVNPVSMTTVAIFELPRDTEAFDGEPVAISLPRAVAARGGWLPLSALLEGERGVWTVLALREREGHTVALREVVEVLHVSGDRAFVRGSVNSGDQIVSDGVHRIAPGARVRALGPGVQPRAGS